MRNLKKNTLTSYYGKDKHKQQYGRITTSADKDIMFSTVKFQESRP